MTQPTDRPGIDHLTSDMLDQLYTRLANAERDLGRLTDMAIRYSDRAIENGERADRYEATLTAVRDELTAIDRDRGRLDEDGESFGDGYADADARIRAVLDQHGQTTKEDRS